MSPFRICTLLFAVGIILVNKLQISPLVIPFVGGSGFFFIFIFVASSLLLPQRFISLHSLRQSSLLYATSLCCGGFVYAVHMHVTPTDIARSAPRDSPFTVAGEITSISLHDSRTTLHLNAHKIYVDSQNTRVRGTLLVQMPLTPDSLAPGMHVLLKGKAKPPYGKRNPGDFDYRSFLAQSRIHLVLDADQWVPLDLALPLSSRLRRLLYLARTYVVQTMHDAVPAAPTRALLQALILGDQSQISNTTVTRFREAGLSHLLAVSGLHVLCVGLMLYALLRPLCLRLRMRWLTMEYVRVVSTLLLMLTYLSLTDFKPAVFRATVMTSIFIIAPLVQRPSASLNTLFVAAFILLVINPVYLIKPGFQLSFAAVASIIHFYPRLPMPTIRSRAWGPPTRYLVSSFYVSFTALIGTLPISLYHFEVASPGGLLLNIAAIPATTGVLISGLFLLVCAPLNSDIGALFGDSADVFARLLLFIVEQGSAHAPTMSLSYWPNLDTFCILSGAVVGLISLLNVRICWPNACLLGLFLLYVQWMPILKGSHHPRLEVLFFDVGHGDAALVTFPNGRHLLVDTGDTPWNPDRLILVEHFRRYRIGCIDAVVVTHPDRDHVGGLQSLVEHHCIHTIYTNGDNRFSNVLPKSSPAKNLSAGDTLALDPRVAVRVLAPPRSLVNKSNSNDGSIILMIDYGATRFLFLGDAEQTAETYLVEHVPDMLPSQVVKVGHHGSRTSSTPPLVQHVAAHTAPYALISSGPETRYGLPDEEVIRRWRAHNAHIHNTAESGALWLSSNGRSVVEIQE